MQLIIKHVDLGADGEANHPKDQEEWIFHQLCKGVEPLEILIFDEHDVPVVFPGFRALFLYPGTGFTNTQRILRNFEHRGWCSVPQNLYD